MIPEDAVAQAALRERQGQGARYDAPSAPALELLWARRGTAYFARKLNELDDAALDAPSLQPGWSRRHVIAHVGFHARALSRLVEAVRTGRDPDSDELPIALTRESEIALATTLPARALRNLFSHAAVHLNVEWRDLADEQWQTCVDIGHGETIPIRQTPWIRSREIWLRAVDLDNGGSCRQYPPDLVDALINDAITRWAARDDAVNLTLAPTDRSASTTIGRGGPVVTGLASDLACWVTGRGSKRLKASSVSLPAIPAWQ